MLTNLNKKIILVDMEIKEHYVTELPAVLDVSAKYYLLNPDTNTFSLFVISLKGEAVPAGYVIPPELKKTQKERKIVVNTHADMMAAAIGDLPLDIIVLNDEKKDAKFTKYEYYPNAENPIIMWVQAQVEQKSNT